MQDSSDGEERDSHLSVAAWQVNIWPFNQSHISRLSINQIRDSHRQHYFGGFFTHQDRVGF